MKVKILTKFITKRSLAAVLVAVMLIGIMGAVIPSVPLLTAFVFGMFCALTLLIIKVFLILKASLPGPRQRSLDAATLQTLREALTDARHLRNELMSRAAEFKRTKAELADAKTKLDALRKELKSQTKTAIAAREAMPQETKDQILEEGAARSSQLVINATAGIGQGTRSIYAPYGLGPDFFYGEQHHKDVRVIEQIAMKTGSLRAREVIARSATNLQHSLSTLLLLARTLDNGLTDERHYSVAEKWNSRSIASLARVMADQAIKKSDLTDAVLLYKLILKSQGARKLDKRARLVFLETLQLLGRSEEMQKWLHELEIETDLPAHAALLRCNDIMLSSDRGDLPAQEWYANLNDVLKASGHAPIAGKRGPGDLLSNLHAQARPIMSGPLVTVMMPTHNGQKWIETAVSSVLKQSWKNIELIIVDDCSSDLYWRDLEVLAKADERIQLFRLPSNQGAYRARNLAFEKSKGDFVTVHDDDDWSHPQKIEVQVKHLLEHPEVIGNMSHQTRIDENGIFLRINDNPEFIQKNYSSMMMRRSTVEMLGGWDDVNRAADAEFHDRVFAVTGKRIVGVGAAPLSFMRARSGSLTAGEIRRGALDFARQTYGISYSAWHERLKGQTEVEPLHPMKRPYKVPVNMEPGMRNAELGPFDIVYITDYRFPGGNSSLVAAEIDAAARAGLTVAIAHLESPILRSPKPFNDKVHAVLDEHSVPILTISDSVEAQLVVIRNPSVLQFTDELSSAISATRLALIVNTAPMGSNGANACFDLEECVAHAEKMFRTPALVYPESVQIRNLIEGLHPSLSYAKSEWPGFIDDEQYHYARAVDTSRLPVVGRHSRDHALKWPSTAAEIRSAYVQPSVFNTRILGGAASIEDRLDLVSEPSVEVIPFGEIEPATFLRTVDFWIYLHDPSLIESFGMSVIEAMASGAVVVLPPYMEPMFGDAAVYAEPGDVCEIVSRYWSDVLLYKRQSERGVAVVREVFSVTGYQTRLNKILACDMAKAETAGIEK